MTPRTQQKQQQQQQQQQQLKKLHNGFILAKMCVSISDIGRILRC